MSGKGGVGKTTLVSNLSFALTELGKDVTAVDTNITTPHLGLHLGFHSTPKTLHDFLRGGAKVRDVVYNHPFGFKIVPASLSVNDLVGVDGNKLQNLTMNLIGSTDFILLDSAPSLGKEAMLSMNASDEIILLTNPNLPAVLDILKVSKVAERMNKVILGVVVNRATGRKDELSSKEIEEIVRQPVLATIPEDENVQKSLAARTSVVDYSPKSRASVEVRRLAHYLIGRDFEYRQSLWERLFGLLR